MTTLKYCDICGQKTNSHICIMGVSGSLTYRDFCQKCWKKVEEFLKTIKTRK